MFAVNPSSIELLRYALNMSWVPARSCAHRRLSATLHLWQHRQRGLLYVPRVEIQPP